MSNISGLFAGLSSDKITDHLSLSVLSSFPVLASPADIVLHGVHKNTLDTVT